MNKRLKSRKGITLVALVITIIILLILAGITIKTLSNNGIFSKAEIAKKEYQKAALDEQMELFKYELEFDKNQTLKSKMIKAGLIDENEINSNGLAKINNNENFIAISSYNGLLQLFANVEAGDNYTGKTIYLVNDIDCESTFNADTGELLSGQNFVPIKEFNGTLDGNNYEIKNLYIKKNNSEDKYTALFAILKEDGIIKNLVISNSYINGYRETGAFVGANYGQITNCINNCTIYGVSLTGGIAGKSYNLIENCINKGNIMATGQQTGGIVGGAWRGNATHTNVEVIISDCENYGNVGETKENYVSVGGIVGLSRATVKNCENYGEIKGYDTIGGIVGLTNYYNNTSTSIENSKNYGSINGKYRRVGGICGRNDGGKILNCGNIGDVTLDGENAYYGVAGIAGVGGSATNNIYIENCYNEGTVTLELSNSNTTQAAGIVANLGMTAGTDYVGYVTNCYNKGQVVCVGNGSSFAPAGIGAWARNVVVKNCYNTGILTSSNPSDSKGTIWYSYDSAYNVQFENNYWLNTCGGNYGIGMGNSDNGAEPKTVTELKAIVEILGDAYAQDNKINEGYPYLIDNRP